MANSPSDPGHRSGTASTAMVESQLTPTTSHDTSSKISDTRDSKPEKKRIPWSKRFTTNPFRWTIPPLPPAERKQDTGKPFIISHLFFYWMQPLMLLGYRRLLQVNDLPRISDSRRTAPKQVIVDAEFQRRVGKGQKRPLLRTLNSVFALEFWYAGACILAMNVILNIAPLLLKYLIKYASEAYYGDNSAVGKGVGIVLGLAFMQMSGALFINQFFYHAQMAGACARGSLIGLIHNKTQVISSRARAGAANDNTHDPNAKETNEKKDGAAKSPAPKGKKDVDDAGWTNGKVANLMSTDTARVDTACNWFHMIWIFPISMTIIIVQLIINIGPSALAGLGLFFISMPILAWCVKTLAGRRKKMSSVTDKRIGLTQEILQSIRFVKYFAWEDSFLGELKKLRKKEIRAIQFLLGLRSAINAVSMSLPAFAAILAFLTYALTHDNFNAANIFSSLALFNNLRMPLNMLPLAISQSIDAYISLERIEEFLLAEEVQEKREVDIEHTEAFTLTNASFTWETSTKPKTEAELEAAENAGKSRKKAVVDLEAGDGEREDEKAATPFHFEQLNIAIKRNELLAIVGTVGCGKSSFLAALAGEMRMTSGFIKQGATMAYCSQYPWIQNATVRSNITFGRPFDRDLYERVVDACALRQDFHMLPDGDLTEVGERGITLSGGQKQRIGIARAVYFNSDAILMDDVLSAVDSSVGKHIFSEVICGMLKDKCRVLATHQLHVLSECDRIIWMQDGKIESIGTYEHLTTTNPGFMQMLAAHLDNKASDEEDGTDASDTASSTDLEEIVEEVIEEVDASDPKMRPLVLRKTTSRKSARQTPAVLMQVEDRAEKGIAWSVYAAYMRASGNILNGPIVVTLAALAMAAQVTGTVWLSWWTEGKYSLTTGLYIGIYAALGGLQMVMLFVFAMTLSYFGTEASKKLLHQAMDKTLRAPMSFFDTTPLGRIVNRFSKDVDTMDNFLTESLRMYLLTLFQVFAVLIMTMVYFPWFTLAVVPTFAIVLFCASFFRATAREVKRHEAVLRSSVFSCFTEALVGTPAIRAYGVQQIYRDKLNAAIDNMNSAYFLTFSAQTWLSVRLDICGTMLALIASLLAILTKATTPSTSALVITYTFQIIGMIQFMIKQLADVENAMTSTERVLHYGNNIPSELSRHEDPITPPPSWPETGSIKFSDVEMRYRDGLPLVLKGLDLEIKGGERIGFVGRTGAGKSSIMSCIFRLVELSGGKIEIDGLDISRVGLTDLRTKLAIIPQDPTLFRGTVRSNLDPFGQHTDAELTRALQQAHLIDTETPAVNAEKDTSEGTPKLTLNTPTTEEGLNFSLGQRQLMALARALLHDSKILICDEATSSIDEETDRRIQEMMYTGFQGRTVLCIAHRLRTIIGYDRVVVMDGGVVVETGAPLELWERENGAFRAICDKSWIRKEEFGEAVGAKKAL